jgi:mono/diheme cytochrome c family protein
MARPLSLHRLARLGAAPFCALLGLVGCSSDVEKPESDGLGVSQIVYAVRQHTVVDAGTVTRIDVAGGMGQVMDYGRFVPGGRLEILDLKTGDAVNVIEDFTSADVSSLDLSFDATKLLFTMKRDAADNYHIYVAPLQRNADGKFDVTQLTFGPYDDQNAVFAAGERIVFTTNQGYTEMGTRADEYNHSRQVTQLATTTLEGGDADRKLCSQNLSHTVTLFPMQDGRIGFSRWEHLENVNDVKLFAMNPDCTQMVALGGQHGKPGNSIVQASESATANVFYSIVTERENTIQAGALVRIDARSDTLLGAFDEEKPEELTYRLLTPGVPLSDEQSPKGRYRSPVELPDGNLLVSWAEGSVNETNELTATPPEYGLYKFDVARDRRQLILDHADTWELYAKPVVVRAEPPNLAPRQGVVDSSTPAVVGSIDVARTSLSSKHGETVSGAQFDHTTLDDALAQAVKVRVIEGFSSEAANQTMFGLTMAEGAALLGEATVQADGSWLAQIPPYVPVHLQAVDEFDLAIRNQTTWIQGMPGEGRVCGGCHEDRTAPNPPGGQALTIAAAKGPENFMIPIKDRLEYPWAYADDSANPREIQKLFNAKCVTCHNETTNGGAGMPQETYTITMTDRVTGVATVYPIPRMDLSDRPITVTYDGDTKPWPASYVSLFYPAALEMEMGEGTEVTGTVPPKWAVPSDARHSLLIEKLNVTSSKDSTRYAWPLGQPFSDVDVRGGTRSDHAALAKLTRDEVVMLTRAIDMGGQFYARQNTKFAPATIDPVAGLPGVKP